MKIIRIGRSSTNDVVISNSIISSQHATLTVSSGGKVTIKDLNSKNGVYVNDKRISSETELAPGDKVCLGNYLLDWRRMIRQPQKTVVNTHRGNIIIPSDIKNQKMIGRDSSAQIRFDYEDVSGSHALLCQKNNGEILIIDADSTNGTFVNGNRITTHLLKKGDIVMIAKKYRLYWEEVFPGVTSNPVSKFRFTIPIGIGMVLLLGMLGWWFYQKRPLTPTEIYERYKKTVVMIMQSSAYEATVNNQKLSFYLDGYDELDYCFVDEKGNVKSGIARGGGTGFFISRDGKIMTNKHVLFPVGEEREELSRVKKAIQAMLVKNKLYDLADNLKVQYKILSIAIARNDSHVNSEADLIACSVYKKSEDDNLDVAIIQTNTKSTPVDVEYLVDLNNIAKPEELKLGKKIYTLGFPRTFLIGQTDVGLEANNQSGEITQERGEYVYGHNICIHQGASGSPVFSEYGRFAGIIVSGFLGISQGYNHAVQPKPAADLAK